jgi:cobalt/nickel transport system ATP-binding protein
MSALRYAAVTYRYEHARAPSVRDVELRVERGERVALVGANGAGKTTLLLLATGLLTPTAGHVEVGDVSVSPRTLREVRRRLSLVFADPDDQLFCASALDEVMFTPLHSGVPEGEARARGLSALNAVGLDDRAEREPLTLSLGVKKRLALATTIAAGSDVWLLDEPTSGLDPRARKQFVAHLATHPHTMLFATHDLDAALALEARVVLLDGGRIVADGRADVILGDEALLHAHGLELPLSKGG